MPVIVVGALILGAVTLAPSVQAQSCDDLVSVVHSSYPADGATGVPTNAPLFVYGPALEVDSDLTLQDESGEDVSINVMPTEGGLFIDPFLGLAPNTSYELTVAEGGDEWSTAFSTGTGPATPVQLAAPDVTLSVIEQDRGSCGVVSAICVNGSVPERMTLEVLVGDEVLSLGGGEPGPAFPANAGSIGASACIDVRVREPGGLVSESTQLCGDELWRFDLAANAAAPQSCQPYRDAPAPPSSDSGGCSMGASGATPCAGGLLFGLSILLVARQRRRAH